MTDFSTLEARKLLAGKYGTVHVLDPALVAAIIEQESSWNPWATRYEPMFYSHYIQPLLNNGTVQNLTEATMRSTSFGLMQIMGQVAREHGYQGRFLTELCDPDIGVDYGCRKLKKCLDKAGGEIVKALLMYNGGNNTNYPIQVQERMKTYF
jgi:soluble lytic murein transglycosylase-like protein